MEIKIEALRSNLTIYIIIQGGTKIYAQVSLALWLASFYYTMLPLLRFVQFI